MGFEVRVRVRVRVRGRTRARPLVPRVRTMAMIKGGVTGLHEH